MDRLICGDVGFGKTEVAIRASFKAVMAGRQVAVLVPTTVLAMQHFSTFKKRFADYPIEIDMISRFRTPAEIASDQGDGSRRGRSTSSSARTPCWRRTCSSRTWAS